MPAVHRLPPQSLREIRASNARLPPSPLLSARMMMVTYFSVTMIIIDQKIRLSTPIDVQLVERQRMMAGEGLAEGVDREVPMSPKTMPIAPTASLATSPWE